MYRVPKCPRQNHAAWRKEESARDHYFTHDGGRLLLCCFCGSFRSCPGKRAASGFRSRRIGVPITSSTPRSSASKTWNGQRTSPVSTIPGCCWGMFLVNNWTGRMPRGNSIAAATTTTMRTIVAAETCGGRSATNCSAIGVFRWAAAPSREGCLPPSSISTSTL